MHGQYWRTAKSENPSKRFDYFSSLTWRDRFDTTTAAGQIQINTVAFARFEMRAAHPSANIGRVPCWTTRCRHEEYLLVPKAKRQLLGYRIVLLCPWQMVGPQLPAGQW